MITQIEVNVENKAPKKDVDMHKEEEKKEGEPDQIVTSWSLKSNKIVDDEEDDTMSIKGLVNMKMLSPTELLQIASTMHSKEKKQIMKSQRKDAQKSQVVDIISSILPEIDIESLPNPIDKLEQLVTREGDQMKTLEEATIKNVEKEYNNKKI